MIHRPELGETKIYLAKKWGGYRYTGINIEMMFCKMYRYRYEEDVK